jgi:hypothetical protein
VSRPAPEPRPGWGLFLAAALFSPLVLVAWLGGAAVLRATGWPRWRLATAATVAAVAVVWAQGGPVPALAAHFSGIAGLVAQFGRPVVHLPLPGAFLWPQVALSVPAGLLLATVQRPGVALEGPDPATVTRARRREDRTRKQAGRLVTKTAGRNFEATGLHKSALGVSLGGDLDAWRDGRYVVLPEYAARLPRLVLGRPGAGKSVYLAREAFIAGATRRQLVALDGKGDAEWAAAVVDAYLAGWEGSREPQGGAPSVHLFPAEPLDAWRGGPQAQVNRLISLWAWSVEAAYYRELCILGLRLACGAPGSPVQSMADLVGRLDPQALARCWQGHPQEAALVRGLRDRLADIQVRVANLAAATAGMLDGTRAIGEADLTVVSLPVMAMQADSEAVFRLVMADLTHWASSRKGQRPAQVMVDEFSAIDGGRDEAIHLLERGRGAGVPVILAGQSYRSLGDDDQRDRLVSAADALVLFGSATPDELVKLAGTVLDTEAVYAVEDGAWTGRASVTHRHRAKVEPNTVRQLAVGEAVIVSRGRAERLLVIPASAAGLGHNAGASRPRGRPNGPPVAGGHCVPAFPPSPAPGRLKGEDQPRPAGAAAGNPAPSDGPAGAVDEREVPPPALPRQGASPATRRPSGGLDPSGHSSVPRKRPPAPGGGSPPDDRQPQEA